jgi:hypothetical protein
MNLPLDLAGQAVFAAPRGKVRTIQKNDNNSKFLTRATTPPNPPLTPTSAQKLASNPGQNICLYFFVGSFSARYGQLCRSTQLSAWRSPL